MKSNLLISLFLILSFSNLQGQGIESFVTTNKESECFTLTEQGVTVPLLIDSADFIGVHRAATNLQLDFKAVTGTQVLSFSHLPTQKNSLLIIGTIGKSKFIDQLLQKGLLDRNESGKTRLAAISIEDKFA